MKKTILVVITLLLSILQSEGQALFPEKYTGCMTAAMVLESDTAKITKSPSDVAELLVKNIPEQQMRTLKGLITLQVIVYQDGTNCVLSIDNKSNIGSNELKLKALFDDQLKWNTHKELPISTLIELDFNQGKLNYRRLGFNTKKGLHELFNAGRPKK